MRRCRRNQSRPPIWCAGCARRIVLGDPGRYELCRRLVRTEASTSIVQRSYPRCDVPLVAADWIVTQFASALSIKIRRGDLSARLARTVAGKFSAFCGSGLRLVPVSRRAFESAAVVVRDVASGLRAGDSLHLAVALEVQVAEIATLDRVLEQAARRQGLAAVAF